MAQKVTIELIDDIDGTEAAETVTFSLDGKSYEIDLSSDNAENLRDHLAPFVAASRKSGSPRPKKSSGNAGLSKQIREWANENGVDVPARGRIPKMVREQYDAAHM